MGLACLVRMRELHKARSFISCSQFFMFISTFFKSFSRPFNISVLDNERAQGQKELSIVGYPLAIACRPCYTSDRSSAGDAFSMKKIDLDRMTIAASWSLGHDRTTLLPWIERRHRKWKALSRLTWCRHGMWPRFHYWQQYTQYARYFRHESSLELWADSNPDLSSFAAPLHLQNYAIFDLKVSVRG